MRFRPPLALQIAVCVLLFAGPALAAGTAGAGSGGAPEAGETTIRIDLRADGNATVTVVRRYSLDGPNETEAFRDLATEFERGGDVGPSVAPFRRASGAASEATGRPMTVGNVDRNATLEERETGAVGRLAVSFDWNNFSRVEDGRLVVGDAFRTPDGTWLPGLAADQRLVISLPDRYVLRSARGQWTIRDGALVWPGPATFGDGDLEIVAKPGSGATPTPTATPDPGGNGTDGPGPGSENPLGGPLPPLFGGVALAVGVAALGAYALAARGDGAPAAGGSDAGSDPGPTPAAGGGSAGGDAGTETGTGIGADTEAAAGSAGGAGAAGTDGIDEDLLSDEERVERLLRRSDGRMRQADIVTETDWSNAKVSQLLSAMDEEGRIDKLRIGRENLISLPEVDTVDPGDDE